MKDIKVISKRILCFMVCMILFLSAAFETVNAAPMPSEQQQVFLDHYQLTNDKIVPGNEFTLTLYLKNIGKNDAHNIIVDIMYAEGVMPSYGQVSQAIVDVPAEGTAEIEFHYIALEKIDEAVLDFQVILRESDLRNAILIRTPVGSQSPFRIIANFVPGRAKVREDVNCSMTFKYLGQETADAIRARMNVNGELVHTIDIGNLPKETTKTQSLFTKFEDEGKYIIELYLDYLDEAGEEQSVEVGSGLVEIEEPRVVPASVQTPNQQTQKNSQESAASRFANADVLTVSVTLIVVIFAMIIFLLKKKK